MPINDIKKIAETLSKQMEDSEKIALPILSYKLTEAAKAYPKDYTIGMASNIIARMSDNKKLFISKAELKDMYNKLYSKNTKFAEVFKEELGDVVKLSESKKYDRSGDETVDIQQLAYEKLIDPVLANALNTAFDKDAKGYNEKTAAKAQKVCEAEFASLGFNASVVVNAGNGTCILCAASVETPNGVATVYVPVEIKNAHAVTPTTFVGNNGPEDLTFENFKNYVVANIGKKLNITASLVLNAVNQVKCANEISNVDLALTRLNALKESVASDSNNILYQNVQPELTNVEVNVPKYEDAEVKAFASNLETAYGLATFVFGKDKVKMANDVVVNKLINVGLDKAQISVHANDQTSITYAVSANNGQLGFYVPVRISEGRVYEPTYIIANGGIESFSKNGLNRLANQSVADNKATAFASPLQHLKASELVENIRESVADENYAKAEEALNVLAQSGDDKAYKIALNDYMSGLKGGAIQKAASTTCSRIVRHAHSSQELCGHTNLPLNKTFINNKGECLPLYRKAMQDSKEGAYFMNSKIFI